MNIKCQKAKRLNNITEMRENAKSSVARSPFCCDFTRLENALSLIPRVGILTVSPITQGKRKPWLYITFPLDCVGSQITTVPTDKGAYSKTKDPQACLGQIHLWLPRDRVVQMANFLC